MNPLILRPEFILLRLKQGDLPLEGFTVMFQLVAHTTSYPDDALCAFYDASLNAACRAPSSEDGPRADFASFVEWTLARNRSSFPACSLENLASVTPDPDPNKPPPRPAEYQPKPTDDGELKPAATSEPSQKGATEQLIVMEPALHEPSDQVREPATMTATVEISEEREIAEDSITHCTTAEGELNWILGHTKRDNEPDLCFPEDLNIEPPVNSEPSIYLNFPPTLPQLPLFNGHNVSTMPPLLPVSPSAHPQPTICAVGSPQVCQSSFASWLEDPSSPPSASESWTPPRPSDPAAPPRLSAPSSPPSPVGPPAPPGSIVLSAPPPDSTPPAAPRRSVPPAPWNSSIPLAQPQSSVAPTPPRTSGSPPPAWSPEPWAPPWPSGSLVSPRIIGSPSPPRALPPLAPPPSVAPPGVISLSSTMAPPSIGSTVGFHHGCGLGLTWLLLLQPPHVTSLAPPSVITSMDYSVTTLDSIFCPPPRSPSSAEAPC
ncbi:Major cell-surface adhesin PAc [Labeo rohita]|uniref:Major cell-surface adhesin PAc n=1 Tax=Labeo rohita TaxID=84645 RepID=A0ABQ8MN59_LABRO|nr:Major cell-surface adhesin PAc [Labeo rohita]